MMILIVEYQKPVGHSIQDAALPSIHFGTVQLNAQHHYPTFGTSTSRTQMTQGGDDQESQLHTSKLECVVQGEIGIPLVYGG